MLHKTIALKNVFPLNDIRKVLNEKKNQLGKIEMIETIKYNGFDFTLKVAQKSLIAFVSYSISDDINSDEKENELTQKISKIIDLGILSVWAPKTWFFNIKELLDIDSVSNAQ